MPFEHRVYVQEKDGKVYVCVDRILENDRRHFVTHHELSAVKSEGDGFELMEKVASWLGNTLLIDNPDFRKHILIE